MLLAQRKLTPFLKLRSLNKNFVQKITQSLKDKDKRFEIDKKLLSYFSRQLFISIINKIAMAKVNAATQALNGIEKVQN